MQDRVFKLSETAMQVTRERTVICNNKISKRNENV